MDFAWAVQQVVPLGSAYNEVYGDVDGGPSERLLIDSTPVKSWRCKIAAADAETRNAIEAHYDAAKTNPVGEWFWWTSAHAHLTIGRVRVRYQSPPRFSPIEKPKWYEIEVVFETV